MPNLTQPWSLRGINSQPSTGRLSSDNNAEKASRLPPLSAGQNIQANHTKHIAAEEEDDSTLTVATVSGCSDQEDNSQITASVVKK
jgi:septin family protein